MSERVVHKWIFGVVETEDSEGKRQTTWSVLPGGESSIAPPKFLQLLAFGVLTAKNLIESDQDEFPELIEID